MEACVRALELHSDLGIFLCKLGICLRNSPRVHPHAASFAKFACNMEVSDLDTRACETLSSRPRSLQQSTAARRSALRSRLTSFPMSTSAVHQTTGSRHFMETSCSPTTPTSSPLRPKPQPAGRPSKPDRLAEGASGLSAGQSRRAAPSAERPARLRRSEGPTPPTSTLMQTVSKSLLQNRFEIVVAKRFGLQQRFRLVGRKQRI